MPNRIIRDGILSSDRVNSLSEKAEIFYRRLMSVVDDFGRFSATPMLLRASCYPLQLDRVKDSTIEACLAETSQAGLVILYSVGDKQYLEIQDFKQRTRASASKFPSPDGHVTVIRPSSAHGDGDGDGDGDVLTTPNGVVRRPNASDAPQPSVPECPAKRIVDLYHEKLPELRRCEKLTPVRRGYLRQRWLEDLETLEDWSAFFDDVRKSDFLMGKKPGRDGRPPFRADLEWLTRPANYAKFIEGKYHAA